MRFRHFIALVQYTISFDFLHYFYQISVLERDSCLPPIRTVAKELRISVITVKKAWEELEHMGFIYTTVGKGCYVASLCPDELDSKRDELVIKKLKKDISYYKTLGLSLADLVEFIRCHYDT
jgi:GntR family transcriptional regulator